MSTGQIEDAVRSDVQDVEMDAHTVDQADQAEAVAAQREPRFRRPEPPWRTDLLSIAIAVVAILLLAALMVFGLRWQAAMQTGEARVDGLAAAVDLAPKLVSYDYRTLPAEVAQKQATTTGPFATEYEQLTQQYLAPHGAEQQFVSQAQVRDSCVVSAVPGHVVAMVYLSQTTTSTALSAPLLESSSLRVTLDEVDGRWLVAGLERV